MTTQPERRADAYQASIDALRTEVIALRVEEAALNQINKEVAELWIAYEKLNKILITGNGVPSLQETVRNMARSLDIHINAQERKDAEWNKLKWLLIAAFIAQCAILLFAR